MNGKVEVRASAVKAAAFRQGKPMCRVTFELYFPDGASFKFESCRPQQLGEVIDRLTTLERSLGKSKKQGKRQEDRQ